MVRRSSGCAGWREFPATVLSVIVTKRPMKKIPEKIPETAAELRSVTVHPAGQLRQAAGVPVDLAAAEFPAAAGVPVDLAAAPAVAVPAAQAEAADDEKRS